MNLCFQQARAAQPALNLGEFDDERRSRWTRRLRPPVSLPVQQSRSSSALLAPQTDSQRAPSLGTRVRVAQVIKLPIFCIVSHVDVDFAGLLADVELVSKATNDLLTEVSLCRPFQKSLLTSTTVSKMTSAFRSLMNVSLRVAVGATAIGAALRSSS